tara:strand:+ start:2686 stop:2898 length:213 start_codon:yes stop_codon:yes gene_type:complete
MRYQLKKAKRQQDKEKALHIGVVVCSYSPFPQTLTPDKKYEILAIHNDTVAIVDDTNELSIYHKCYFKTR